MMTGGPEGELGGRWLLSGRQIALKPGPQLLQVPGSDASGPSCSAVVMGPCWNRGGPRELTRSRGRSVAEVMANLQDFCKALVAPLPIRCALGACLIYEAGGG